MHKKKTFLEIEKNLTFKTKLKSNFFFHVQFLETAKLILHTKASMEFQAELCVYTY